MENKRFLQPFLLEDLEIILRKKEQVLQELNGQLRGMRGGSLHVKHKNGRLYYCEYVDGRERGISKDEDKIYRLARKEYLQKAIRRISEECVILKTMIQKAQKHSSGKKEAEFLHKMIELDCRKVCWSEEKCNWATTDYPKNNLYPENLKYATKSGRKMRSKSERTIGNKLEDRGIVYWYDSVLDFDGGICSPDFWIRKDSGLFVIWEHLGLLGDPAYDKQNERKIEIYHGMGFREHTNLILTTEEDIENPGVLDGIIERFLLS